MICSVYQENIPDGEQMNYREEFYVKTAMWMPLNQ